MVAASGAGQTHSVLQVLADKLLAADTTLPEKYRVLFSLRNLPGEQARNLLATGTICAMDFMWCAASNGLCMFVHGG